MDWTLKTRVLEEPRRPYLVVQRFCMAKNASFRPGCRIYSNYVSYFNEKKFLLVHGRVGMSGIEESKRGGLRDIR